MYVSDYQPLQKQLKKQTHVFVNYNYIQLIIGHKQYATLPATITRLYNLKVENWFYGGESLASWNKYATLSAIIPIGFIMKSQLSSWYQSKLYYLWSPTATCVSRHLDCVARVFSLKIQNVRGCVEMHLTYKRNDFTWAYK